jgi:hypothetical protein
MAEATITNPTGAFRTTSDFIDGWDAAGELSLIDQRVVEVRADAAVTVGQALMIVAPTATVPVSVTPMTAAVTGTHGWRYYGAALTAGAAGDVIQVIRSGIARVRIDAADTAAAYSLLLAPDTTTGRHAIKTAAAAGDIVVGQVLGIEDASGTADFALCQIGFVPVLTVINT